MYRLSSSGPRSASGQNVEWHRISQPDIRDMLLHTVMHNVCLRECQLVLTNDLHIVALYGSAMIDRPIALLSGLFLRNLVVSD